MSFAACKPPKKSTTSWCCLAKPFFCLSLSTKETFLLNNLWRRHSFYLAPISKFKGSDLRWIHSKRFHSINTQLVSVPDVVRKAFSFWPDSVSCSKQPFQIVEQFLNTNRGERLINRLLIVYRLMVILKGEPHYGNS